MNVICAAVAYSIIISCWLPLSVLAATPLQLTVTDKVEYQQFSYQFTYQAATEHLQFSISRSSLAEHFRHFRRYQPDYIQHYIWRDLQQHAAKHPNITLKRLASISPLRYQINGADPARVKQVSTELSDLMGERQAYYLHDMYYTKFQFTHGQLSIIPDHVRITFDSLADLAPIAAAITQQHPDLTPRQMVEYISNWLQQIPYQNLSDRQHSSGNSFNVPLKLLAENRGDCDSKAVLLAALIKLVLPEVPIAIIYPPNHAMLAVSIKPIARDNTTMINGQVYVLVDATGPALLKVGEISPQYKHYIANGQTDYRLF